MKKKVLEMEQHVRKINEVKIESKQREPSIREQTIDCFDGALQKLTQSAGTIHKEKYEKEVKKEIRKLKKHRDILNAFSGPDLISHPIMAEGRKRIENVRKPIGFRKFKIRKQAIDRYRARFTDNQRYHGDPIDEGKIDKNDPLLESFQEAVGQIKERLENAKIVVENNNSKKKKKTSERSEKILLNLDEAYLKTSELLKIIEQKPNQIQNYV